MKIARSYRRWYLHFSGSQMRRKVLMMVKEVPENILYRLQINFPTALCICVIVFSWNFWHSITGEWLRPYMRLWQWWWWWAESLAKRVNILLKSSNCNWSGAKWRRIHVDPECDSVNQWFSHWVNREMDVCCAACAQRRGHQQPHEPRSLRFTMPLWRVDASGSLPTSSCHAPSLLRSQSGIAAKTLW